jgi:hypothetical protein
MTSQRELIRKYEPLLRFGTDKKGQPERFFPMAAHDYVHTCGLRRRKAGWIQQPGDTLLTHLSSVTKPEECYLVFAAGDVPDFPPDILMALTDNGLELGQAPAGNNFEFESMAGESSVTPRILVDSQQAEALEAALAPQTPITRRPVAGDELLSWFEEPGGDGSLESLAAGHSVAALETAALNLEWVQFPALNPLPAAIRNWAVQKYAPFRDWNNFPPVYHYHICHDRGYQVLQYWFLYPYNDWASHGGNNDHEGDWEVIYVFLDEQENARHVAYSKHVTIPFLYGPDTAVWQDVEKVNGMHPVVYVGCGSHASYLRRGKHRFFMYIDRAKGDHLAVGPGGDQPWGEPVQISGKKWNSHFSGPWGALVKTWFGKVLPDTEGPSSPAQKKDKWARPAKWANIPQLP